MRILCDACESAAAIVFCAADEAALCCSCDEKVIYPLVWKTLSLQFIFSRPMQKSFDFIIMGKKVVV